MRGMVTNDARCTCEIKSRNAMAKAAFIKNKTKSVQQEQDKKSVNWT